MNKKWFLTLLVSFLLIITTGHTIPQNLEEIVEKKTTSDSLTVNLKFQNPNLILRDNRTNDILEQIIKSQDESDNEIASAINNVSGILPYIVESQERRYESAMDYLQRKSGQPPDKIEKFIQQKRLSESISSIVLITCLLLLFVYTFSVSRKIDWRLFVTLMLMRLLLILLVYFVLQNILQNILFVESYTFHSLIKLSG